MNLLGICSFFWFKIILYLFSISGCLRETWYFGYFRLFICTLFLFYLSNQKYKRANLIGIVVVLIIIVLGFPIWTGTIFSSGNGIRPSAMIEIPPDYYEVANLLKSDPTALTLSLPLQGNTWLSSNWNGGKNGYVGIDILRWLTHTPIIRFPPVTLIWILLTTISN